MNPIRINTSGIPAGVLGAVNLAEPIGTAKSRQDQHGIVWVAVPEDRPTPKPPVYVVRMLDGR